MAVTPLSDMRAAAGVSEIVIPGYVPEETLTIKVRRPSLLSLAQSGRIPNALLPAAAQLFGEKSGQADFSETAGVIKCIVDAALVEPTAAQLASEGIELTDVQMMYIYNYVLSGVDQLSRFRKEQTAAAPADDGQGVPKEAQ